MDKVDKISFKLIDMMEEQAKLPEVQEDIEVGDVIFMENFIDDISSGLMTKFSKVSDEKDKDKGEKPFKNFALKFFMGLNGIDREIIRTLKSNKILFRQFIDLFSNILSMVKSDPMGLIVILKRINSTILTDEKIE